MFMKALLYFLLFLPFWSIGQTSIDSLLSKYNNESIPYISAKEVYHSNEKIILLDAREFDEYNVSHIKDAIYIGYDHFNIKNIERHSLKKDQKIVIYCSLGVRSEDIGEKFKKAGFKKIFNLHGGIFDWKNNNLPVVNAKNETTNDVHVYSKDWAKWLINGTKVY